MGTTFVALGSQSDGNRRGFWVRDSLLEVWLRFLALHVEDPTESDLMAADIRDGWLLASRGYFTGCVPDGLESAVSTPEGDTLVRAAIRSLLDALEQAPPGLNKDVLNLMGFTNGEFQCHLDTWRLIEVGRAFLDLLDGKITSGPGDAAPMPGG